jgi:hypothetical protein
MIRQFAEASRVSDRSAVRRSPRVERLCGASHRGCGLRAARLAVAGAKGIAPRKRLKPADVPVVTSVYACAPDGLALRLRTIAFDRILLARARHRAGGRRATG